MTCTRTAGIVLDNSDHESAVHTNRNANYTGVDNVRGADDGSFYC